MSTPESGSVENELFYNCPRADGGLCFARPPKDPGLSHLLAVRCPGPACPRGRSRTLSAHRSPLGKGPGRKWPRPSCSGPIGRSLIHDSAQRKRGCRAVCPSAESQLAGAADLQPGFGLGQGACVRVSASWRQTKIFETSYLSLEQHPFGRQLPVSTAGGFSWFLCPGFSELASITVTSDLNGMSGKGGVPPRRIGVPMVEEQRG